MGADRGILVESDVELQPLAVAKLLKAIADKRAAKLIILGKPPRARHAAVPFGPSRQLATGSGAGMLDGTAPTAESVSRTCSARPEGIEPGDAPGNRRRNRGRRRRPPGMPSDPDGHVAQGARSVRRASSTGLQDAAPRTRRSRCSPRTSRSAACPEHGRGSAPGRVAWANRELMTPIDQGRTGERV